MEETSCGAELRVAEGGGRGRGRARALVRGPGPPGLDGPRLLGFCRRGPPERLTNRCPKIPGVS